MGLRQPPEALAGASFLDGDAWGPRNGMLAVAALRGQKLLLMRVGPEGTDGAVSDVEIPAELDGEFGRLRGVYSAPDGAPAGHDVQRRRRPGPAGRPELTWAGADPDRGDDATRTEV